MSPSSSRQHSARSRPDRHPQLVAAYREAYGDNSALVGKTKARATGRVGPLLTFNKDGFHGAVVLDPVIVRVLRYESGDNRMLELKVPPILPEFEQEHQSNADATGLVVRTCNVLAEMAPAPSDAKAEAAAVAGVTLVSELMIQHMGDAAVQAASCRALGGLLPACSGVLQLSQARECIEMVTAAMRQHPLLPNVQEVACLALASLQRPDLQSIASTNGAIEQVVGAMASFPDVPSLQRWACGALASLAANHPANQSAVAAARGVEAIASAMKDQPDLTVLQITACGALGNLAANHPNNQSAVAASGAIELVCSAMEQHSDSVALQQSAIAALWCLIKGHPENQALVIRLGGRDRIIWAVQRHAARVPSLRAMAAGALKVLIPDLSAAMATFRRAPEASARAKAEEVVSVVSTARTSGGMTARSTSAPLSTNRSTAGATPRAPARNAWASPPPGKTPPTFLS
mmetsp:Transcript_21478/g.39000  ORF Transcript_21478/g.39000 Transcript_21478/m.39000 type:complete len:462 (-) Transcript_21478:45-1430(-)